MLMFVSDGKETGIEKWSEIQKEYASELSNATVVELYCGHYVHNYKQEQISEEMKEFIENIK
jgi:pyridoxine 5'-phosphate synthase PdxJ